LAAEHVGKFGLLNAELRCSVNLSQPLLFQDLADFADELSFDEQAAGRRASEIGVDVVAADFVIRFEIFSVFGVSHVSFPLRFLLRARAVRRKRKQAIVPDSTEGLP